MKRFLLIALAVVMILALCACDKDQTGPNAQVGNSSATGTTGGGEENRDPADPVFLAQLYGTTWNGTGDWNTPKSVTFNSDGTCVVDGETMRWEAWADGPSTLRMHLLRDGSAVYVVLYYKHDDNGTVWYELRIGDATAGDMAPALPYGKVEICEHTYTEVVTKEATCSEEGIKTFTCGKCNDTYTEPIPKAEHTYADATCTAPKTCSDCGVTQGDALGHSYKDGKCTRCNAKQENYKALNTGRWQLMALSNSEELCKFSLYLQKDRQELSCGFGAELSTLDPEFQKDLLEHPEMLVEFEGKKYYFGMGDGCELTYSDGAKVEIKLMDSDSRTEYESTIVLERIAGDQLQVVSVTGQVLGTGAVKEGMIFTWAK